MAAGLRRRVVERDRDRQSHRERREARQVEDVGIGARSDRGNRGPGAALPSLVPCPYRLRLEADLGESPFGRLDKLADRLEHGPDFVRMFAQGRIVTGKASLGMLQALRKFRVGRRDLAKSNKSAP